MQTEFAPISPTLAGKVALITGGAKGIGEAIVESFRASGAEVLICDTDREMGQALAERVNARFHATDVSDLGQVSAAVASAVAHFGRLDVLVNNAGIFPSCPALEISPELWDRVFSINLRGAFFACQAAARQMVAQRAGGSILNIASVDAWHPSGALVHYDASKAGLVMMSRSLAVECGPHQIRVNVLAPGAIKTPGADAVGAEMGARFGLSAEQLMAGFLARIPLRRQGLPADIGPAAAFLCSDAARYITGASLVVDGGMLLG